MTNYIWNGGSGDWDSGNWTPTGNPSAGDSGSIPSGSVVSEQNNSETIVSFLTLDLGANFSIAYGYAFGFLVGTSFTVLADIVNAGTITADDATSLEVAGDIDNSGTIFLDSSSAPSLASPSGDGTFLFISGSVSTLTGGGQVVFSDFANNQITGADDSNPHLLINADNTISGAGSIDVGNGDNALALTNQADGVIDADLGLGLVIQLDTNLLTNAGLIEATNTGGMTIVSTTVANTGTILAAGSGDNVYLATNADIEGGTLETTNGGLIEIAQGGNNAHNTLDGSVSTVTITAGSTVQVNDGQQLDLLGTIDNAGTLSLDSAGGGANLFVSSATVTLTGGGDVVMSLGANNQIIGANDSNPHLLVNVDNTISGAGSIDVGNGDNALAMANQVAGVIDANLGTGLVIQLDTNLLTNAGLIEATGTGDLAIVSTTIANTGTILASGTGDNVLLATNALIEGGTLKTTGGGLIEIAQGGNNAHNTLDGAASTVTITAGSTVQINDGQQLDLRGTVDNAGTLSLDSTGDGASLFANTPTVTLIGGGQVLMSDAANNQILGVDDSASHLLVNVDNTISGAGTITQGNGSNALALTNQALGVIDANQGNDLVIQLGTNLLGNAGLIEATGTGGLAIVSTSVTNTGTILAAGAGDNVYLQTNARIEGGTLKTTNGGLIEIAQGGNNAHNTLDGSASTVTITSGSTVQINDGQQLDLLGTIDNEGTISLDSAGGGANLFVNSATATLTGGGSVVMSDAAANQILGVDSGSHALVNVDNTISGAGTLTAGNGNNALALTNEAGGVIDANQASSLTLHLLTNALVNAGLIEATGTGDLVIQATTITNTGTILAAGTGDNVLLAGNAGIAGGTLSTTGGGVIAVTQGSGNAFDGATNAVTITTGSTAEVADGQQLGLLGTIHNAGTLSLESTGDQTTIIVNSATASLTGGGDLVMSDSTGNQITGLGDSNPHLLINAGNTISGAGTITDGNGNNALALTNQAGAVIDADRDTALVIQLGTNLLTNAGLVEATGTGGLVILNTTVANSGTILATGTGDSAALVGQATIDGGTLATTNGGVIDVAAGGNNTFDGSTGAVTISAGSTIEVNDNQLLNLLGTLHNAGTLGVDSTTDQTSLVVNSATVALTGGGQVVLSGDALLEGNNGPAGDTLVNADNTISGAGQIGTGYNALTITNEAGGVIQAAGGSLLVASTIDGTGTLATQAGATLVLENTSALYQADTLELEGGGAIALSTTLTAATAPSSIVTVSMNGGTLEFSNQVFGIAGIVDGTTVDVDMQIQGTETPVGFAFASAAAASSAVVQGDNLVVACFAEGTMLLTENGEMPVQNLREGDRMAVLSGRQANLQPVAWIGHRRIDCRRHPRPQDVWPIRVKAQAFGDNMPHRDLLLSPDHAVFVTGGGAGAAPGALIPIRYLINATTIAQEPVDDITYWHVELPRHDVLLAEGLRCESYLDTGNRAGFENTGGPTTLHPDFAMRVWREEACARLVLDGPEVAAAHAMLLQRAETLGHEITDDPDLYLRVDGVLLRPVTTGQTHRFRLPPNPRVIHLMSRNDRPAHLRAGSNDHRNLGIALSRIALNGVALDLTGPGIGAGWHAAESDGAGKAWRWTDGNGELLLHGGGVLEINLELAARYWKQPAPQSQEERIFLF